VQEAGSPIVFAATIYYYCFYTRQVDFYNFISTNSYANLLYMIMFEVHYIHRAFIYTYRAASMSDSKFFIMLTALGFTCANGYLNAKYIIFQNGTGVTTVSLPVVLLGIVIFFYGMVQNMTCDYHLIALRRKSMETSNNNNTAARQYFIPNAGLFKYVSAGNYCGEIIEWFGFALASQNCASIQFVVFTFLNLFPRGLATHRYYKDKFKGEYPASRRAVIPFIW